MKPWRNLFMHKLKKTRSPGYDSPDGAVASVQSRTMMLAQASISSVRPVQVTPRPGLSATSFPPAVKPKTVAEQYWAARALTAEALLSVKTTHHEEIRKLSYTEAERRSQELAALHQMHEARQSKLEKFTIFLITLLVALAATVLYFLFHYTHTSKNPRKPRQLHFTIPILSPFTSVVEHETSAMNTRTLAVIGMISACLGYACFRYWLRHGAIAIR